MSRNLGRVRRDWRKFLTPDERKLIKLSDGALEKMEALRADYEAKFAHDRQMIVNRAIQRAKYAAREKLGMSEAVK